jgi:lipase chaperone LimK
MMRPPRPVPDFFDADTGADEMAAVFGNVTARRYDNALEVTDAGPLVDYLLSVADDTPHDDPRLREFVRHVEGRIARLGSLRVSANAVLLEAVREPGG